MRKGPGPGAPATPAGPLTVFGVIHPNGGEHRMTTDASGHGSPPR
jgi:hypothetical protein